MKYYFYVDKKNRVAFYGVKKMEVDKTKFTEKVKRCNIEELDKLKLNFDLYFEDDLIFKDSPRQKHDLAVQEKKKSIDGLIKLFKEKGKNKEEITGRDIANLLETIKN
jgi:hypothetical protein